MPRSRPAWPIGAYHAQLDVQISTKYQQLFNRSGGWANINLPSFSVGSVRARSVFSVESAEFGSVANNDVTF